MHIYPTSAGDKLGFDVLLTRLRSYTLSTLGDERLDAMRPGGRLEWVRAELERVGELAEAFRFDDRVPLDPVLDVRPVLRRAAPRDAFVGPEDLQAVQLVLGTLRRLRQYMGARRDKYPRLHELAQRITPLPQLEERIGAVVDENANVRDHASPELARLRRAIVQRQAQLRETLLRELRKAVGEGFATEEQPTIRNGRMVIPVRAEAKRKVQGFVHDASATGQTVFIEPAACLDLNNEVRELESAERAEVERLLRVLTAAVREHLDALKDGMRALAAFDLLQAKARLTRDLDAVVPQLVDEALIDVRGGRNPVLLLRFQEHNARRREREVEAEERSVVPLDLALGVDYHTLVITGPNAGGKTVAMKSVGLMALMLSYGLPVPVDPGSRFGLFGRLIVDIGDEQDLEEDLSTFSSHVANLKHMLRHADDRTLVLIDEAGTGTDPAEGGALAQAVLEHLSGVGARTIATTHHGTLKVFAHQTDGVENGSMQFDQATLSPTYRFQPGVPGSSYAFDIAQRIGLDPSILARARTLMGEQTTALEDLISTFEARTQALDEELAEARSLRKQAEHERRQYEDRARKLKKDRDQIRAQALQEAERIVQGANAEVERTIREIKEAQAEKEATKEAREGLERFKQQVARRQRKTAERQRSREREQDVATGGPPPRTAPEPAAGPLKVGDQVVLDSGTTAAEILELNGREAVIAIGTMHMRVKTNRLTKVGGKRPQQVTVKQSGVGGGVAAMRARPTIDLRGQRVDEALAEVTRFLDDALAANLERVEILHGKGTGALREAIHELLATTPEVASYDEAPIDQGGAGVTLVQMR